MKKSSASRIIGFCTFVLSASMAAGSVYAAEHEWKMATSWGGGPLMEIGAQAFADKVEMLTDGRVEVQVFTGGTLGKALSVAETVKNGVAQAGHTWMGYDWGKDKTTVVFGGFAGSMDSERMLHWLYEGGGLEMWRDFRMEKFGVVSMPLFIRTAEAFLHSNKPVRTMDDLQGLKVRTAGAWLEISESMGAAPVTMPGAEVYTSLERGTIDATEWGTLYENISPGFHKIAKYVVIPGVHQPVAPFELLINKDAYEALSDRDRQLVDLAAKLVTFESWTRVGHEDAKALRFFREAGNEIIELDEDVQVAVKQQAIEWGKKQGEENEWFKKAYESQLAYEELWKDAKRYRNVASPSQ
ncbi:MAG: C4-dicarboxylate ABC transporter substrate-binding protein [Proteobacteria bacterium]|nr:MAG: C4-dicarboxylate ABC transporter substrate-binding protein [Pseudomonadota bacterium]